MQKVLPLILALRISGLTPAVAQVQTVDPLDWATQNTAVLLKAQGVEINETALIQALQGLHDTSKFRGLEGMAARMLTTLPKNPRIVAALRAAFADAMLIDRDTGYRDGSVASIASALAAVGETGWENSAVTELPKMGRIEQLQLAHTLARVGRAEGWPIVRAALADDKPFFIMEGLFGVEYFDQLPNPDGGQPIDVVAQLRQLASATPENLIYGADLLPNLPESLRSTLLPVRKHIELYMDSLTQRDGLTNMSLNRQIRAAPNFVTDLDLRKHIVAITKPVASSKGTVTAKLTISKTGIVSHIDFSSGTQALQTAYAEAAHSWSFRPFDQGEVLAVVTVTFENGTSYSLLWTVGSNE